VPGAFMSLEALPLTPNGKVDRKALPAPEGRGVEEGYVPPCTPTEELLAGIWAEVLRQERGASVNRCVKRSGGFVQRLFWDGKSI